MRDRILRRYARLSHLTRSDNPAEAALARERMSLLEALHPWVRSGHAPAPRKSRAEMQSMLDMIHLLTSSPSAQILANAMGHRAASLTDLYVSGLAGGVRPDGVDAAITAVWQATVRMMRARQAGATVPATGNPLSFWDLARQESDRLAPLPALGHLRTSENGRPRLFSPS